MESSVPDNIASRRCETLISSHPKNREPPVEDSISQHIYIYILAK
jgi:hypothetical protein